MKTPIRFGRLPLAVLVLVVLIAAYATWHFSAAKDAPAYKLAKLEAGPITASVSATGTLNPVVSVQVGSQVSGQITEILVDFNSPVKAGQLIARIDPDTFTQRVRQAEADMDAARATLAVQQAQVAQAQANLLEAQRDFTRKQQLVEKKFVSAADRDKAQTTRDAAAAALQLAQAQLLNGQAQVRQRQALLVQAQVDLQRTSIRSPVDGVVVKRSVDMGQTVAASLQAPELFIIAKNLTDMQVETSVDEADVGRIQPGQHASFTVDAFPGRHFTGEVRQVRKAASIVSNVVSYTVVISAANPDLILLPGMTANVRIVTAHKDNALKVANAALRFRPASLKDAANGDARDEKAAQNKTSAVPPARPAGSTLGVPTFPTATGLLGRLWVVGSDGAPQSVDVRLGLSDGGMTEILTDTLKAGSEVITGLQTAARSKSAGAPGPRMF
ncbi:MAG: efflux RND transporter periplasmic adaptor subunit [Rugosibacter sp.]